MKRILSCLALLAAVACSQKQNPTLPVSEYEACIENISVVPTDNTLRFKVDITTKKSCEPFVEIRKQGEESWQKMPGTTAILLYPNSEYECRVGVGKSYGDPIPFTTGAIPENVSSYQMTLNDGGPTAGYLIQHKESAPGCITISDVYGQVLWYEMFEEPIRCVDYNIETGKLAILHGTYLFPDDKTTPKPSKEIIVMGLDGTRYNTIKASDETIRFPHHEIRWLPNGNLLTINHASRDYDLTSVGKPANSTVWSDIFVEIDLSGKPVWEWNLFDQIDLVAYWPILKKYRPKMGIMKDFVHTNSLAKDAEGNYYASLYYPEEIWKIDGKTKEILYKFGPNGDITLEGGYPLGGYHSIVLLGPDKFLLNKNPRKLDEPCRAQIFEVDPKTKTAVKLLDVASDLEFASTTSSNVQLLPDGNTILFNSTQGNACIFTDMTGKSLRIIRRYDTCYRSFYFEKLF